MQTGGWTITWQGTGNDNSNFPGATSIFAGLRDALESTGGNAVLSSDGSYTSKPDVAVVVFGETPYAEGQGDIDTLAWQQTTQKIFVCCNNFVIKTSLWLPFFCQVGLCG